ncbi:uncharacterized protein LOC120906464 [Anopheles arabiensis]|uniref:uncharacterized protein LOC120906464 n=1 Tax=Anopheles arabiensis TaxID=7173 RepID=UPI001AAD656F|nr:uncharacterized protein LOC120906464 [Anopheles arabiensis]
MDIRGTNTFSESELESDFVQKINALSIQLFTENLPSTDNSTEKGPELERDTQDVGNATAASRSSIPPEGSDGASCSGLLSKRKRSLQDNLEPEATGVVKRRLKENSQTTGKDTIEEDSCSEYSTTSSIGTDDESLPLTSEDTIGEDSDFEYWSTSSIGIDSNIVLKSSEDTMGEDSDSEYSTTSLREIIPQTSEDVIAEDSDMEYWSTSSTGIDDNIASHMMKESETEYWSSSAVDQDEDSKSVTLENSQERPSSPSSNGKLAGCSSQQNEGRK